MVATLLQTCSTFYEAKESWEPLNSMVCDVPQKLVGEVLGVGQDQQRQRPSAEGKTAERLQKGKRNFMAITRAMIQKVVLFSRVRQDTFCLRPSQTSENHCAVIFRVGRYLGL